MSETIEYRHICGYPLEEGSELARCPGCGGRITPWNVKAARETFPTEADADTSLQILMRWLVEADPALATSLSQRLAVAVEGTRTTDRASLTDAEQLALRQAATALQRARSSRSGD